MNVLVDTSVWSLALRRRQEDLSRNEQAIVAELSELIREGRVRLIGLVRQELLSGIRSTSQFETLKTTLRSFPDVPPSTEDHEFAAKISNECRAEGLVVSVVDILLCGIVISRNWSLFSMDSDFEQFARILPLKLHVPRK
jgi:predicted nucleic acid-binding protein